VRLISDDGVSITLRPTAYEFLGMRTGDWDDLNWLRIAGEVDTPEGAWGFNDPCLLTTEAAQLGAWLRAVAARRVPPSGPTEQGEVYPSCDFTEPNVAFGVEAYGAGDVSIRVHFSLESAPPWSGDEQRVVSRQFFVRCQLPCEHLRRAADEWSEELHRFPERGESDGST
jgi:hypothetical protein